MVSTAPPYDDALLDALARVYMEVALERLLAEVRQAEVRQAEDREPPRTDAGKRFISTNNRS